MTKRKSKRKAAGRPKASRKGNGGDRRHPHAVWKGAVSFGLVYIPVHLHTAARDSSLDLDLLDRRDFAPVGYQRYNKRTGKVVEWGDIVKGYEYRKGQYVVLTDEDFRRANVKARTIRRPVRSHGEHRAEVANLTAAVRMAPA